ncbi:MAG: M4 family metallopeptidase [Bacteroidota bacterium]
MKRLLSFALAVVCVTILSTDTMFGQNQVLPQDLAAIATQSSPGWLSFRADVNLDPKNLFKQHKQAFGLGMNDEMVLVKSETDKLGFSHYRYQLTHKDIEVEGVEYIVHAKNGVALTANGLPFKGLDMPTTPSLLEDQALALTLSHIGAKTYMWELPGDESSLKEIHNDPLATHYPKGELMIADVDFDPNTLDFRLVWKFDVFAAEPMSRKWVYVNALTGEIIKELETLHTANSVGTAVTKYSGIQSFVTDSTANNFRLRAESYGAETGYPGVDVITLNLRQNENFNSAVDFTDDDNYWDNANPQLDEVATDAHWGAQVTHDYYYETFGRSSYDGNGSPIYSYVHFDSAWFNAFWRGDLMAFGDGNNNPLISIDILAHEFSHGVTGNSAGLIYANESGALNESFSDIFGNAVEFYADSTLLDWRVGEKIGTSLRSMSNPNAANDPDTYRGSFWWDGFGDNGGVHINSGVQNYWYYLLVEGGTGTNDHGDAFDVPALGFEKASQIAYRNLTVYLTRYSQFRDAREGALQAAEDLYGSCSIEYQATAAAWHAVGLGDRIEDGDFRVSHIEPIAPCGNSSEEIVSIEISYEGCDTFPGGPALVVYSVVDPVISFGEQINLPGMLHGVSYPIQFSQPLQMNQTGEFELTASILEASDPNTENNDSRLISAYRKGFFTSESVDFENYANSFSILDSIHLEEGEQATVEVRGLVGNDDSYGVMMEGGITGGFYYQVPPFQDIAAINPEYVSRMCLCVDASKMDSLSFSFDKRQTFSPFLEDALGNFVDSTSARRLVNNLQVFINDNPLDRFNPISHTQDPWTTHTYNLDSYVGQTLNICFRASLYLSEAADPNNLGDKIFLDNINFSSVSSAIDFIGSPIDARSIDAYPNPSAGTLTVEYEALQPQSLEIQLLNALGQRIQSRKWEVLGGMNRTILSLEDVADGIYTLQMTDEEGLLVKKIVLSRN